MQNSVDGLMAKINNLVTLAVTQSKYPGHFREHGRAALSIAVLQREIREYAAVLDERPDATQAPALTDAALACAMQAYGRAYNTAIRSAPDHATAELSALRAAILASRR